MPERSEKIPAITEKYLQTPELPKVVIVQLKASRLEAFQEEMRGNELASVIRVSTLFKTLLLSSPSVDFIRSLTDRDCVLKILPNLELRMRSALPTS